jgi:hypothetical protein
MLVNRDNWQEAPITEQNEVRLDIFKVFKTINTLYEELDCPKLKRTANVALSFDNQSFHIKTQLSESVLSAIYEADVDFCWYPFDSKSPKEKLLIYASENWLSIEKQRKLFNYVKKGGNLVFFNNACLYDEKLKVNNLFGLREPDGNFGGGDMIYSINDFYITLKNEKINVKAPLLCYNKVSGRGIKPFIYNLENSLNVPSKIKSIKESFYDFYCGCEYKIGKGRILSLFLQPDADIIKAVCRYFKISLPSKSVSPEVTTTILKGNGEYYLFVLNNALVKQAVVINIEKDLIKKVKKATDLINRHNKVSVDKKNCMMNLNLNAKDATVIRLIV